MSERLEPQRYSRNAAINTIWKKGCQATSTSERIVESLWLCPIGKVDIFLHACGMKIAIREGIQSVTTESASEQPISKSGDASRLFTREAVMVIHEHSAGIPRTISVMCDNALVSGFALGRQPIDREVVMEVARDFDLKADESVKFRAPAEVEGVEAEAPTEPPPDDLPGDDGDRSKDLFSQTAASRRFGLFGSGPR